MFAAFLTLYSLSNPNPRLSFVHYLSFAAGAACNPAEPPTWSCLFGSSPAVHPVEIRGLTLLPMSRLGPPRPHSRTPLLLRLLRLLPRPTVDSSRGPPTDTSPRPFHSVWNIRLGPSATEAVRHPHMAQLQLWALAGT
ncbi:hypothetical protein Landi51_02677 [Colletotrichum acutatum]